MARKNVSLNYWTNDQPLKLWQWVALAVAALLTMGWSVRRLFTPDYNFVGNNADMAMEWIPKMRFFRAWTASGLTPWWNPDILLGTHNLQGVTNPYSVLSQLQSWFHVYEKGLDYALAALLILCGVSTVLLFKKLGLSPLASLLGGVTFATTGTLICQLYSGHIGLYASMCLGPLVMLSTQVALRHSRIQWCFPAALAVAAVFCAGSLQGAYMVVWLNSAFFLLRCLLGSATSVPAPTVWTVAEESPRGEFLLAIVKPEHRARETGFALLKLALIYVLAGLLSSHYWSPALQIGPTVGLDLPEPNIFAHSAPLASWLTVFIPHFFVGAGENFNWTGWASWEGQPGMAPTSVLLLMCALLLRPRRDLWLPAALLVFGSLIALGQGSPFFGIYAHLDPLVGRLEVPSRMYFVTNFAFALTAAYGLESLIKVDWSVAGFARRFFTRVAAFTAGVWIISFYLDGNQAFWAAFLDHLQNGYGYRDVALVDPAEYYVLTWTRLSAVSVVYLCFIYSLLRAPLGFRRLAIPLLILVDTTRFNVPYFNLRPETEFLAPAPIVALLREKKMDAKVCNLFEPSWNGAFGLQLQLGEWNTGLAMRQPASADLLLLQARLARTQNLDRPMPLQRALGVGTYIHPKEYLDNPDNHRAFARGTTFEVQNQPWRITLDLKARPPIYLSRSTMVTLSSAGMIQQLFRDPKSLEANQNFVDVPTYRTLAQELSSPQWRQLGYRLSNKAQETVSITKRLPTMLEAQCLLEAPAMVILNQAWTEDWQAYVDDFEARCYPCQMGSNRGVLVGPGPHVIRFEYAPRSLLPARRISWLTLVSACLYCSLITGLTWIYRRMVRAQ